MLAIILILKCIFLTIVQGANIIPDADHIMNMNGDYGSNLTLPCCNNDENNIIKWEKPGKNAKEVLKNSDLFLQNLQLNDSGIYKCSIANEDRVLSLIKLTVRTPPPALEDVSVIPSSILAVMRWTVKSDGGYNLTKIIVRYREENERDWHYVRPQLITPCQTEIYQLNPNSSYIFQIWARNKLGDGEVTSIKERTLDDKQEIELGRHLLQGAEAFDARIWLVAVTVVMTTLIILSISTCCITYRDCLCSLGLHTKRAEPEEDPEKIELISNVTLNPGLMEESVLASHKLTNIGGKGNTVEDEDEEDVTTLYFACLNGAKAINV